MAPKHTGKDTTITRHARVVSSINSGSLDDSSTDEMGIDREEKHKEVGIHKVGEDVNVTLEGTSMGEVSPMTKDIPILVIGEHETIPGDVILVNNTQLSNDPSSANHTTSGNYVTSGGRRVDYAGNPLTRTTLPIYQRFEQTEIITLDPDDSILDFMHRNGIVLGSTKLRQTDSQTDDTFR